MSNTIQYSPISVNNRLKEKKKRNHTVNNVCKNIKKEGKRRTFNSLLIVWLASEVKELKRIFFHSRMLLCIWKGLWTNVWDPDAAGYTHLSCIQKKNTLCPVRCTNDFCCFDVLFYVDSLCSFFCISNLLHLVISPSRQRCRMHVYL